jgi:hypothetical protein
MNYCSSLIDVCNPGNNFNKYDFGKRIFRFAKILRRQNIKCESGKTFFNDETSTFEGSIIIDSGQLTWF